MIFFFSPYWFLLLSSVSFSSTWVNSCRKKWECRTRRWVCQHWSCENRRRTNMWHSRAAFKYTCEKNEREHPAVIHTKTPPESTFTLWYPFILLSAYFGWHSIDVWGSSSWCYTDANACSVGSILILYLSKSNNNECRLIPLQVTSLTSLVSFAHEKYKNTISKMYFNCQKLLKEILLGADIRPHVF